LEDSRSNGEILTQSLGRMKGGVEKKISRRGGWGQKGTRDCQVVFCRAKQILKTRKDERTEIGRAAQIFKREIRKQKRKEIMTNQKRLPGKICGKGVILGEHSKKKIDPFSWGGKENLNTLHLKETCS